MAHVRCYMLALLLFAWLPAYGQKYEITPLVGARFGGTVELEQAGAPNFKAHLADSVSSGVTGGGMGGGVYRIGGGVSAPTVLFRVAPEYSEEAGRAKFQGTW